MSRWCQTRSPPLTIQLYREFTTDPCPSQRSSEATNMASHRRLRRTQLVGECRLYSQPQSGGVAAQSSDSTLDLSLIKGSSVLSPPAQGSSCMCIVCLRTKLRSGSFLRSPMKASALQRHRARRRVCQIVRWSVPAECISADCSYLITSSSMFAPGHQYTTCR